jgi:hypothetical protein
VKIESPKIDIWNSIFNYFGSIFSST